MEQDVAGSDALAATVVCTVTLSILAHGLSANPFAAAYAQRAMTDPALRTNVQNSSTTREPVNRF